MEAVSKGGRRQILDTPKKTEEQAGPQVKELRGVIKVGKGCEE